MTYDRPPSCSTTPGAPRRWRQPGACRRSCSPRRWTCRRATTPGAESPPAPTSRSTAPPPTMSRSVAYTSGTTGSPKGAVLTHANVLANSESIALTWRWEPSRPSRPRPSHLPRARAVRGALHLAAGGGVGGVAGPLRRRRRPGRLRPSTAPRCSSACPPCTTGWRRRHAPASWRACGWRCRGLRRLRAELHAELATRAGTAVLERYGMTETLMTLSNPYDGERRAGTVGFPFPGVRGAPRG